MAASVRTLSRQVSAGTFAILNGYDPEATYAAGVSDAEAAAAAAAEGEQLQPPAEAAYTAAQEELVRADATVPCDATLPHHATPPHYLTPPYR